MTSWIRLQWVSVVPSSGGELEGAVLPKEDVGFSVVLQKVRPLWIRGLHSAVELGET